MKLPSIPSALTTCAALLFCLAAPVLAQPEPAKLDAKAKSAADAANDSNPWLRRLPEVKFDGVPMSEVTKFLFTVFQSDRDQHSSISFIVRPDAADIPITLHLRSVNLEDILEALELAALPLQIEVQDNKKNVVFGRRPDRRIKEFKKGESKPVCRAYSLSRYLAGKSDKDVHAAMQEVESVVKDGWAIMGFTDDEFEGFRPRLQFHRGTKILILAGFPQALEAADQIINQLEGGKVGTIDPTTKFPIYPSPPSPPMIKP